MNLRDKILEAAAKQNELDVLNTEVKDFERELDAAKAKRDEKALEIVALVREMNGMIPEEPEAEPEVSSEGVTGTGYRW